MKILLPAEVQQLIIQAIELARTEYTPTSENVLDQVAKDNAAHYWSYEKESLVSPDEKIQTSLQTDRETMVGLYIDSVNCQNPGWDNEFGSIQNDCFYYLGSVKFIDLLLENCFSVALPVSLNSVNNPKFTEIAMSVSHVIDDKTLVDWLFESMNYNTFIQTRSPYEQELIY